MTDAPHAPLVKRVPTGAWMTLLWCVAIACTLGWLPGLPLFRGTAGPRLVVFESFSSTCWQLLAPTVVMVLSAFLLRRRPLFALAVLLAASLAAAAIPSPRPVVFLPVVPVGIAICFIAASRPRRVSAGSAAATVGILWFRWLAPVPQRGLHRDTLAEWLVIALAAAVAWLIGYAIRQNRGYAEELRAHAITAERLRIAREVHDMVAHSIGIIAIQAGAGSRVIDTQPEAARDALSAIEATSRDTLAALQHMLSAWRRAGQDHEADALPPGPTPGLTEVNDLVRTAMDAGVHLDVQWRGPRRQLPADIDASAFRIIQEAVTNVIRHAGASQCQVIIDQHDSDLAIEVIDNGCGGAMNGAGYGIAGMRERAALLHGHLTAGPQPAGGFRVAAQLPVPAAVR